jgi:hypothetical protein
MHSYYLLYYKVIITIIYLLYKKKTSWIIHIKIENYADNN